MSRESAAAQSVVVQGVFARPEPPADLNEAQAKVWRAAVDTKPPDFFDAAQFPILADYCRAVVLQNELSEKLCASQINDFDKLAKLKTSLARSLRLTNQSRYTPASTARAARPINQAQRFGTVTPHKPPPG